MKAFRSFKITVCFAAILAAIFVFGSCSQNLTLREKNGLPVVIGTKNSQQLNAQLEKYFKIARDCAERADGAMIKYNLLREDEENCRLTSGIYIDEKIILSLPDVLINRSGRCSVPALDDTAALSSAEYIFDIFELARAGIDVSFEGYGQPVNKDELGKMLEACENIFCKESPQTVQAGAFSEDVKFCEATGEDACRLISEKTRVLQMNNLGTGGEKISDSYAARTLLFYLNVYYCGRDVPNIDPESLYDLGYGDKNRLSRSDLAKLLVTAYEEILPGQRFEPYSFCDTESPFCSAACAYGLLPPMFCGQYYEPYYRPSKAEFNQFAVDFVRKTGQSGALNYQQAVHSAVMWLERLKEEARLGVQNEEVINRRSYDWYVDQNDGSEYAAVNCMPAITCMALKWSDPESDVRPDDLRKIYPEIKGGWWMQQITDILKENGVDFAYRQVSAENIIEDISAGELVLSQCSENNPMLAGHCMVIYGYKKVGDTVVFLANDPDGIRDRELESGYAEYIISRFVTSYISVSGKKD
ncbi:MAG: hypothetical protein IJL87_07120 [Clostridia bacterium]|nr:hypothetical protein [Clostridia bacterium]